MNLLSSARDSADCVLQGSAGSAVPGDAGSKTTVPEGEVWWNRVSGSTISLGRVGGCTVSVTVMVRMENSRMEAVDVGGFVDIVGITGV